MFFCSLAWRQPSPTRGFLICEMVAMTPILRILLNHVRNCYRD